MCTHKTEGKWPRIWRVIERSCVVAFLATETYGLATEGTKATYSYLWEQRIGSEQPCRHTAWGRTLLVGFFAWAAIHLGWSRLGLGFVHALIARLRRGKSDSATAGPVAQCITSRRTLI